MIERITNVFVMGLVVYTGLGAAFALAFVSVGVQKIDPEARGAGIGFRA